MKVAIRKPNCLVCSFGESVFQAVNAVIWDARGPEPRNRTPHAIADAGRTCQALTGRKPAPRTLHRHAAHVEASARTPTESHPASVLEVPLVPTTFEDVVKRVAVLGMRSADVLERNIESTDPRVLATLVGQGVRAVTARNTAEQRERTGRLHTIDPRIEAIFVFAANKEPDLSDAFVNVTPLAEMRKLLVEERAGHKRLQQGE